MLNFSDGSQLEKAMSIGSKSPDVTLRVVGPRLFIVAPDAAICYNLDSPDDHCQMFDQESEGMSAHSAFVGQDYMVVVSPAPPPGGNPPPVAVVMPNAPVGLPQPPVVAAPPTPVVAPTWNVYAFRRQTNGGKESGRLDYDVPVTDASGITSSWQPMDGGLVYLSADHKLHLLLGTKN
jgi:hypothetical protein